MRAALRAWAWVCAAAVTACGPEGIGPTSSEGACQRAARALVRLGVDARVAPSSAGGFRVQVAAKDTAQAEAALTLRGLPAPPSEAPHGLHGPGERAAARREARATEAAQALEERDGVVAARVVVSPTGASVQITTQPETPPGWTPAEVAAWLAPSLELPADAVRVEVLPFAETQRPPSLAPRGELVTLLAALVMLLSLALLRAQRKVIARGAE